MTTDRDRLAADLHPWTCGSSTTHDASDHAPVCESAADRLIALGWTRLDERTPLLDETRGEAGPTYDLPGYCHTCGQHFTVRRRKGWEPPLSVECPACECTAFGWRIVPQVQDTLDEEEGLRGGMSCEPATTHRYERIGTTHRLRCVRCWKERDD